VLIAARTARASEPRRRSAQRRETTGVLTVRIAREPAETSGALEESGRRRAATCLADGERRDERAVNSR
jgi:hypothetical protein